MSGPKDGGPAFPHPPIDKRLNPETTIEAAQGMSLRDWFAGQALAGLAVEGNDTLPIAKDETKEQALIRFWSPVAEVSYIIADAMLAEREKP